MQKEPKKILVVEDEKILSDILRDSLENAGFTVIVASDGQEGLAMALDQKPDFILLDILMPKKDGLSMLQDLRATEQGRTVPVMMLTNLSDIEDVNQALATGAYAYIIKSDWDMADVVVSIQKKLGATTS